MLALCVRSYYSLMWATPSPEALCRAAKFLGYSGLALTDTDNLYGLWEFLRACSRHGLKPVAGAEITDVTTPRRALCLMKNARGFKSLCRLLTARHTDPGFNLEKDLPRHCKGLEILTTSAGLLAAWRGRGLPAMAALPRRLSGQTFRLRKAARKLDAPMVAVAGSFFVEPGDYLLHRVQRAIALNTSLSRLKPGDMAPPDAWLASPGEFCERFEALPQALRESEKLARRLEYVPAPGLIMPPWDQKNGKSADEILREKAYAGSARRYGKPLPVLVKQRLEHELDVIAHKQFSSYFLVVQDIVSRSPRICGRGSGAASLVAYSLGITNVCPIKFNLFFERFINPQRIDPPDIDIDFAWDERDEVINSVLEQYRGRAAMVGTHILFRGRMAIREVAKVYGMPAAEIKRVIRSLPWMRGPAEGETGMYPKRQALPKGAKADLPEPWPEILNLAQGLMKMPRHISVHVGGVVITPGPISDYAPLETAPKGVPIIQWEKEGAEKAGLVKIDLLGNRSLAVIRDAIAGLRECGQAFDESLWQPEDDPATRELVRKGRTMGCFYIESPATRLLQEKARRGDYEHMVIHSSIIRPAANDYIQEYLRRLHGGAWEPLHPLLADILDETYGIMVYQEQVSQAAMALAGFSHAQGDRLRKVMSWKEPGRALKDFRDRFEAGARARGVTPEKVVEIWHMMLSFSGYSFCKPHSASYARVSFQAAYLKAHHPAQFMAAVISNQGGFYSAFAYVSEARRLGLKVLPPCINQSRVRWLGRNNELRVGLMAIKGLGRKAIRRMLAAREERAFSSFADFMHRVRPADDEAKALINAGSFETLHPGREPARLLWQLAQGRCEADKAAGPEDCAPLFRGKSTQDTPPPPLPPPPVLPPSDERERLRRQYAVLGFLPGRHPMELFASKLKGLNLVKARDLPDLAGSRVRLAGWLITGKTVTTRKLDPMEFRTFEDETGVVEATFFPEAFHKFHMMLESGRPYILSGLVEENYGAVTLTVDKCHRL